MVKTDNTQEIINKLSDNNSKFVGGNLEQEREQRIKKKAIKSYIGKFCLLTLTLLTFARVPFVGSYLDGLIDYLLGFGKYVFYAWAIFVLIGWTFNTGYTRVIKSKKFFIISLLGIISASCIVSGVTGIMDVIAKPLTFNDMLSNYHSSWFEYFKGWDYPHFFNWYVTGGVLAEIIAYGFVFLSYGVLIAVATIILVICIFVILNVNYRSTKIGLKLRGWMVRKLGGTFKYDGYNELKAVKHNQNKFKKAKRTEVEASAIDNQVIPFGLLPETDIEKYDDNFKYARKMQNKLYSLFKTNNIDCVVGDINVYTSYTDVCFESKTKADVKNIIELQPKISKIIKQDRFNMSIHGNIVNVELDNVFFSKISLKSALNLTTDSKTVRAVVGIKKSSDLVVQNFRNSSSALVVGKKGSGAATLAVLMALSICYTTSPDELELVVLNPNCEATYTTFGQLPHIDKKVYESTNDCTEKLHELQNLVNERNSLLKVNNVSNIDQYNKIVTNQTQFKHILVLIGNVDSIMKDTFQNNKILGDIISNGRDAGVYVIMQSYTINNDVLDRSFYNDISEKYILALGSQEESMKVFNNNRGCQLHANGDCLHFSANRVSSMERIQTFNINFSELTTDIDIIKTFYVARIKQKEADLLARAEEYDK